MSGKVAISLEEGLLADIERRRAETGESRSAFIRRAVQAQLARETEAEKVARYVQGYLEQPEDDEQVERARRFLENRVGRRMNRAEVWWA